MARYEMTGGRDHIPGELAEFVGKTVASIEYGVDDYPKPHRHGSEVVTFTFTDGSELTIREGSNIGMVGGDQSKIMVDLMFFSKHPKP